MKRIILLSLFLIIFIGVLARALIHAKGLTVTSWWRSPWKNQAVEGKAFSLHLIGWAFDIVPVNKNIHELLAVWPFKWVVESDHIHLQIL